MSLLTYEQNLRQCAVFRHGFHTNHPNYIISLYFNSVLSLSSHDSHGRWPEIGPASLKNHTPSTPHTPHYTPPHPLHTPSTPLHTPHYTPSTPHTTPSTNHTTPLTTPHYTLPQPPHSPHHTPPDPFTPHTTPLKTLPQLPHPHSPNLSTLLPHDGVY